MNEELVTIPARLLVHLTWAAESLSRIEPDEDDTPMISEARRAIDEQAPRWSVAMLETDVFYRGIGWVL